MKSASATTFDEAYYQRFYFDKKTSVVDPQHMERLGTFVCSYLKYLRVPVRRVLDVGCGIGLWKDIMAQHFPAASYQGVEFSPYLCERFGWQQGSVVDYAASEPFDVIVNDAFSGNRPLGPLKTDEGARVVHEHLAPGGVYLANVRCAVEGRKSRTLHEVIEAFGNEFAHVAYVPEWPDKPSEPGNNTFVASDRQLRLPAAAVVVR